ncbi:hypothetical protein KCV07_g70, partial [Aureobasidium melanogenum]
MPSGFFESVDSLYIYPSTILARTGVQSAYLPKHLQIPPSSPLSLPEYQTEKLCRIHFGNRGLHKRLGGGCGGGQTLVMEKAALVVFRVLFGLREVLGYMDWNSKCCCQLRRISLDRDIGKRAKGMIAMVCTHRAAGKSGVLSNTTRSIPRRLLFAVSLNLEIVDCTQAGPESKLLTMSFMSSSVGSWRRPDSSPSSSSFSGINFLEALVPLALLDGFFEAAFAGVFLVVVEALFLVVGVRGLTTVLPRLRWHRDSDTVAIFVKWAVVFVPLDSSWRAFSRSLSCSISEAISGDGRLLRSASVGSIRRGGRHRLSADRSCSYGLYNTDEFVRASIDSSFCRTDILVANLFGGVLVSISALGWVNGLSIFWLGGNTIVPLLLPQQSSHFLLQLLVKTIEEPVLSLIVYTLLAGGIEDWRYSSASFFFWALSAA